MKKLKGDIMEEVIINKLDIACEHISFQLMINVNHHIGIVIPNFQRLDHIKNKIIKNIKMLSNQSIDAVVQRRIQLINGSHVSFFVITNDHNRDQLFRGYRFNDVYSMIGELPTDIKIHAIQSMIMNNENTLYIVNC